jgi:hypothetical protein
MINRLENIEDENFLQDFISLPQRVREEKYNQGLASEVQTRKLVIWGYNNHSAFWLIKSETNETIMRIGARVNPLREGQGTIGFFELNLKHPQAKEAFKMGTAKAIEWLSIQGAHSIVAPVDLNTWFSYRFSVMSNNFFPRFSWEPTTPPEYLSLFIEEGFRDFAKYHSIFFPHFRIGNFCLGTSYMKSCYQKLIKQGFSLRPFDQENFLNQEIPTLHKLSHEAFSDSLLFEPIDINTFSELYAAGKNYDSSPSAILIDPEDEIAGFIYAFYDGDFLVIKSLAIRKKYQGFKLSSGLIYNAVKQSFQHRKKGTISALVRTGIASEKIERNSNKSGWFTSSHEYVLLHKGIEHE